MSYRGIVYHNRNRGRTFQFVVVSHRLDGSVEGNGARIRLCRSICGKAALSVTRLIKTVAALPPDVRETGGIAA